MVQNPNVIVQNFDRLIELQKESKANIIDIPNSPIYLEYIGDVTACWNEIKVLVSNNGHTLKVWDTRNGHSVEVSDVSAVLGHEVYIDVSKSDDNQVRIIPFDPRKDGHSNTTNNNTGFGLSLKGTDGNFYFCDVSNVYNANTESNWKVSKFWEKKNTNRKIVTKNASLAANDPTHFRYDTTLPDNMYTHTSISENGFIEYQDVPNLRSLGPMAKNKKLVMIAQYNIDEGCRVNLWATSDGGENFVSIYDFSPSAWSHINFNLMAINTSSFPVYNNDLVLHKVIRKYPSVQTKEPEHSYDISNTISITSISSSNECIVTAPAHGLESGNVIAFESNSNTDWKQLSSTGLSADSLGDNAYFVEKIDNDRFYLRYFRGSYDTVLTCRHIHSVNSTNYGFLFCTGEQYPDGWELYVEQNKRDGYVDAMTDVFNIYRLNSSEHSVQRCCGALLSCEKEPNLIVFEDETNVFDNTARFTIDGREETLAKNSSYGIWKGKLSKIDSFYENYERIAASPEPSIWMYQIGDLIVNYLQLGGLMVSADGGKTFTYIENIGNGVVRKPYIFNGVTDNCICFSRGYIVRIK